MPFELSNLLPVVLYSLGAESADFLPPNGNIYHRNRIIYQVEKSAQVQFHPKIVLVSVLS